MRIDRFQIMCNKNGAGWNIDFKKKPSGKYVLYDDYKKNVKLLIDGKNLEIRNLKKELEAKKNG